MTELHYPGEELELFSQAHHWKNYWLQRFRPYVGEQVLEVGAGLGANASLLLEHCSVIKHYTALELDPSLYQHCLKLKPEWPSRFDVYQQTLQYLDSQQQFNSILYIDVLEHIEHDAAELQTAFARLQPGGYLLVLVPAHPFLYAPFDKAIGHFRRYNKSSLKKAAAAIGPPLRMEYLDSLGFFASLMNKCFLRQKGPSLNQVLFWDRQLLPWSRRIDPLLHFKLGKTLTAVWKKES